MVLPRIWAWDNKKNMPSKNIAKPLLILGIILVYWMAKWISEMIVSNLSIGNSYSMIGIFAPMLLSIGIFVICSSFLFIMVFLVYCAPKSQLFIITCYIWIAYLLCFLFSAIPPIITFLLNPQLGFHVSLGPPGGYQISTIVFFTPILFSLMAESYLTGRLHIIIYRSVGDKIYGARLLLYLAGAMVSIVIMLSFIYQTITEHTNLYDFHLFSISDFESIISTIYLVVIFSTVLFIILLIFEYSYAKIISSKLSRFI